MSDSIPLKRVVLHDGFIVGGRNFGGDKIDAEKDPSLKMWLNEDTAHIHFEWLDANKNKHEFCLNSTAAKLMVKGEPVLKYAVKAEPPKPKGKIQAQVETPQSHVFAGVGGGKVVI